MRLLLDTHAFLWWILDDPRLSDCARGVMGDGAPELLLSAASTWEMAIKQALGQLQVVDGKLGALLAEQMARQRVTGLPVEHAHAWRVAALPPLHRDPFDRLLIAQAQVEEVPILTADPLIARYDVATIW